MKILVTVKRVIDPYVKVQVLASRTGVVTQNVKHSMNPFDEIAMEQAARWLEAQRVTEVVAVSVGTDAVVETLRVALARGATRALHLKTEQTLDTLAIAKLLAKVVEIEKPNLVLMGKQAIDNDCNHVPQMLAGLLDWPQATFASKIELRDSDCRVVREVDSGLQTLDVQFPCVVSVDLRLNEPRYISIPNIMQAKRKPLEILQVSGLGVDLTSRLNTLSVEAPLKRSGGKKVESLEALLDCLKNEARVIS